MVQCGYDATLCFTLIESMVYAEKRFRTCPVAVWRPYFDSGMLKNAKTTLSMTSYCSSPLRRYEGHRRDVQHLEFIRFGNSSFQFQLKMSYKNIRFKSIGFPPFSLIKATGAKLVLSLILKYFIRCRYASGRITVGIQSGD